jgi:small subunit ribosomal protein S13
MVDIKGEEIPNDKNILVGFTHIFGIGRKLSRKIIDELSLNPLKKVRDLKQEEIKSITDKIKNLDLITGSDLREELQRNLSENIRLGTYKGIRMNRKPNPLPIRGQRTRSNARF